MTETQAVPLQYKRKWEVRQDIADAVCRTDRMYGPDQTGFVKRDLVQVAYALGVESPADRTLGDLTLAELYREISAELGLKPPETAGNQWSLNKQHLKAIHRRVYDV